MHACRFRSSNCIAACFCGEQGERRMERGGWGAAGGAEEEEEETRGKKVALHHRRKGKQ